MDNRRWFGLNLRKLKKKGAKRKPGKGTSKSGVASSAGDAEDERAHSDGSDEEREGVRGTRNLVPLAKRDAEEIEEWDDWERSPDLRLRRELRPVGNGWCVGQVTMGCCGAVAVQMVRHEP
jgi:hypothetical protein